MCRDARSSRGAAGGAGNYALYVNARPRLNKDRAVGFTFRIIRFVTR